MRAGSDLYLMEFTEIYDRLFRKEFTSPVYCVRVNSFSTPATEQARTYRDECETSYDIEVYDFKPSTVLSTDRYSATLLSV